MNAPALTPLFPKRAFVGMLLLFASLRFSAPGRLRPRARRPNSFTQQTSLLT